MTIGLAHYLTVAAILFTLGIFGIFLNRKNVIIILMSIELMLLAVNINFVAFSVVPARSGRPGLRHVRADRGGGRGGDRPCHPRRLFPQPRHHRGRRHRTDEGLSDVDRSLVVFLPLLAAAIAGFFGRVIGDRGVAGRDLRRARAVGDLRHHRLLSDRGAQSAHAMRSSIATWIDTGSVEVPGRCASIR